MVSALLIALVVALASGSATTYYLRHVHRVRLERAAGMRIIAGMRWREFSQLVVEALRGRGFESDSRENTAERGQQADLILRRDGQSWLLACKQGENYQISPAVVAEFSRAVRLNGAAGGLIATPGRVSADASRQAGAGIELMGRNALWPLLKPLLPDSVRNSIATESHALTVRYVLLGWLAAVAIGAGIAWVLPAMVGPESPATSATPASSDAGPQAGMAAVENPAALVRAPLSDEEQREQVRIEVSDLPGIDRAMWSTRSTLLIYLDDDSGLDHLQAICAVVERYDDLRASRLQLQPAPGSQRPVRFLQCRVF